MKIANGTISLCFCAFSSSRLFSLFCLASSDDMTLHYYHCNILHSPTHSKHRKDARRQRRSIITIIRAHNKISVWHTHKNTNAVASTFPEYINVIEGANPNTISRRVKERERRMQIEWMDKKTFRAKQQQQHRDTIYKNTNNILMSFALSVTPSKKSFWPNVCASPSCVLHCIIYGYEDKVNDIVEIETKFRRRWHEPERTEWRKK